MLKTYCSRVKSPMRLGKLSNRSSVWCTLGASSPYEKTNENRVMVDRVQSLVFYTTQVPSKSAKPRT